MKFIKITKHCILPDDIVQDIIKIISDPYEEYYIYWGCVHLFRIKNIRVYFKDGTWLTCRGTPKEAWHNIHKYQTEL
jgi:hypothetical protein